MTTDCCAELRSELALLRAEVSKLGKVDEDSIIQRAFNKSKDYLEPIIGGVSTVAVAAGVKATNAFDLGELASIKAGTAFSEATAAGGVAQVAKTKSLAAEFAAVSAGTKATQASALAKVAQGAATAAGTVAAAASTFAASALGKALLALANIATIAGSIAGLFALYATLQVVFPRLDAHDRELQAIESQLAKDSSSIFSLTTRMRTAEAEIQKAIQLGERALDEGYSANLRINVLIPQIESTRLKAAAAQTKADDVESKVKVLSPKVETVIADVKTIQPKVEDNTTKIQTLSPKVETVIADVKTIQPKVEDNTTKIRVLTPKVDEAIKIANEALKAKSIPGKNGLPGKDAVSIPGTPGKDGVGIPGKDGVGIPGKDGVGIPGKDGIGIPGKDAKEDPALRIRVGKLEVKVQEQEIVNQEGLTLIKQLPTVIEPQIVNAVTKTVNAIVPISIKQATDDVEKIFNDISIANRKALEPQFKKTIDANRNESLKLANIVTESFTELDTKITTIVPASTPGVKQPTNKDISDEIKLGLGIVGVSLVGITSIVKPIALNTTPAALQTAAASGTCQTLQPGGCMSPLANNAQNAANNSANNGVALSGLSAALSALGAAISAIQTAFLVPIKAGVELINGKLGPLMKGVGGIGGFLGRVSTSMGVDRALNLIAIAANLHNAMMLSANLKITLLEMLSSVGNATGLLQNPDNENVDLNQVFNAGIEQVLIKIIGVDSYAGLKVGLRKYNAIYQAATNSLNAVSSMFNSMGNVIEQGAEYTGKIGNSLKGAGLVVENAYSWMSEKFDTKSNKFIKFQSTIGDVTQVLETINEIAETVVEGQQSATEFQKANKDFIKAVEDAEKGTPIENKAVKEEAAKAKENATKDPTGEIDTGLLSFLTN